LQATNLTATDEEPPENNVEEQDSQEQLEELLAPDWPACRTRRKRSAAARSARRVRRRAGRTGRDAARILYENQREENNPELKYLIFTEFVPTQTCCGTSLNNTASRRCLNGSMDLEQRRRVQRQFAEKARILVSTDAGGEGLNLQFAHIVVNYDLPWNPMKIRAAHRACGSYRPEAPVKAFNLIFEDSVELRVQEVLEEKLATILDEFGVDKTQDVLDSAESGAVFERLYAQAILNPGDIEKNVDQLIAEVSRSRHSRKLPGDRTTARRCWTYPGPAVEQPPAAVLVERMATALPPLRRRQGAADLFSYTLEWPTAAGWSGCRFRVRDAQDRGLQARQLEDSRIRRLVQQLPRLVVTEPIPCVIASLPAEVVGYWSLWRIASDNQSLRD
jgi:hypothetical protein